MGNSSSSLPPGGCFGFLVGIFIAVPIVTSFFPRAGMEYFLASFGSILVCVVVGSIVSQRIAMARDPSIGVRMQVSARQKSAVKKRIQQNAHAVVQTLGDGTDYSDSVLEIKIANNRTMIVLLNLPSGLGLVYESTYYPEKVSLVDKRIVLKKNDSGNAELTTEIDYQSVPESLAISCYIPGAWEQHLLSLRMKSWTANQGKMEEARRQVSQARQEEIADQKRRFGLD